MSPLFSDEHLVAAAIESMEASRLHAVAVGGQSVLLPLLEERTLPGA
jgi:hypothetical protein